MHRQESPRSRWLSRVQRCCAPGAPGVAAVVMALALTALGCGGGRRSAEIGFPPPDDLFVILRTAPSHGSSVFLNEVVTIDFTNQILPDSVDTGALSFVVFDLHGNRLAEGVQGSFRIGTAPGDTVAGRRLEFHPQLPSNDTFDDGGFRPGRRYVLQLAKAEPPAGVGLRDRSGQGLLTAFSFGFRSVTGTTPQELFKDTREGGPRRVAFEVTPRDPQTGEVGTNELGQAPTEIRLHFDQPLGVQGANLPVRVDFSPAVRRVVDRGRVYLEYDDPEALRRWIPASVVLERNELDGAVVVLRPFGVLPNNATIDVVVESTLEDITGESNVADPDYERVFGRFETDSSYALRFDALVEDFLAPGRIDFTAAFAEPFAELLPGAVRAGSAFEGGHATRDYRPTSREVVLDTDFTQFVPPEGEPYQVSGGVFRFRDVTIRKDVTVRGTGSNPMVWLVDGDFTLAGQLLLEGGDGKPALTLGPMYSGPTGGVAVCGGGNGGRGSPVGHDRSPRGEAGFGPGQVRDGGGEGGRLNCADPTCGVGSGGGGGSHATQGDPYYVVQATATFVQPRGIGGYGCGNRTSMALPGGAAGPLAFTDSRLDNDFWGAAVDRHRGLRITGELPYPLGGAGGGGGGNLAWNSCALTGDPNFVNDEKGGGGGAGGGVLIVKARGDIVIEGTGRISAAGGDGAGGAWYGASNRAGGGGGGAGGTIVLIAGRSIRLAAGGQDFALSADGGIGRITPLTGKYGVPMPSEATMNARPSGGMGGLGIIQLMAPPGRANADGTNTVLDDNIHVFENGVPLLGVGKQRYLAWRGMPDASGVMRDDAGNPVSIGSGHGGMYPSPLLMPAPFGNRSRLRSKWIDLGAVDRRNTVPGGDGLPRGVERQGGLPLGEPYGPLPEFAGVRTSGTKAGFVEVRDNHFGGVTIDHEVIAADLEVASIDASSTPTLRGGPAIEVRLRQPNALLGATPHRYSHYRASLRDSANPLGEFRILGHTADALYLSREHGSLASVPATEPHRIRLDVLAKFFDVHTGDQAGFSESFIGRDSSNPRGVRLPRANVRIGFAFHEDPANPTAQRFPADPQAWFFDWANAASLEAIRAQHPRFVQYDILFDTRFEDEEPPLPGFENTRSPGPDTPRPELRRLVLPYRY